MRLKAAFNCNSLQGEAVVVCTALKKYGMIMADNGGDYFVSGAPDPRWNNAAIDTLKVRLRCFCCLCLCVLFLFFCCVCVRL